MSFTLTRTLPRTINNTLRLRATATAVRTMSSNNNPSNTSDPAHATNPDISKNPNISNNPIKSETESQPGNSGRGPQFGLAERQPTEEERKVMDDILNLYQLNPVSQAYQHYDQKAVFSDPIGIAKNLEEVKAQFNAMPKIFSASYTRALKFLDNPEIKAPSFQVSQSQEYHMKLVPFTKTTDSRITFIRDPATNLILRHEEEWLGEKNQTSEDGFIGSLQEARKKIMAQTVNAFVDSTPYDQQSDKPQSKQ